jgi:hypothetical protein
VRSPAKAVLENFQVSPKFKPLRLVFQTQSRSGFAGLSLLDDGRLRAVAAAKLSNPP